MVSGIHIKDIEPGSGVLYEDELLMFFGIIDNDEYDRGQKFAHLVGTKRYLWSPDLLVEIKNEGPPRIYSIILRSDDID